MQYKLFWKISYLHNDLRGFPHGEKVYRKFGSYLTVLCKEPFPVPLERLTEEGSGAVNSDILRNQFYQQEGRLEPSRAQKNYRKIWTGNIQWSRLRIAEDPGGLNALNFQQLLVSLRFL